MTSRSEFDHAGALLCIEDIRSLLRGFHKAGMKPAYPFDLTIHPEDKTMLDEIERLRLVERGVIRLHVDAELPNGG